jgi:hypothetical protein
MTLAQAYEDLKAPLQFGNPKQIAAVRYIERYEEARELAAACKECEGTGGEIEKIECEACRGSGEIRLSCTNCTSVTREKCNECQQTGKVKRECGYCEGRGTMPEPLPCACIERFTTEIQLAVLKWRY